MIESPTTDEFTEYFDVLPVYYPDRHGWAFSTRRELYALNQVVPPSGMVLEVGSASGVTMSKLAEAKPNSRFYSIDLFIPPEHVADVDKLKCPDGNHEDRILNWHKNRRHNQALWLGSLQQFHQLVKRQFDVIFVDAGHMYDEVYPDLVLVDTLLAENGWLVAHDYNDPNWKQVTEAVDRFCADRKFTIQHTVGSMAFMKRRGGL